MDGPKGNNSSSKFDRHRDREQGDGDEDDDHRQMSKDHDLAFVAMAIEMKKNKSQSQGNMHKRKNNTLQEATWEDDHMSQHSSEKPVIEIDDSQEMEAEDYESNPSEREKMEMRRIELAFEERTAKMAPLLNLPQTDERVKLTGELGEMMRGEEEKEVEISSQVIDEVIYTTVQEKYMPAQPSRKSKRVNDDGTPMATKAEMAREKLNNLTGMKSNSSFSCFHSLEPQKLLEVANDSMIDLSENVEIALQQIVTMQAKETAQATVLEAKRRIELEKQKLEEAKKQMVIVEAKAADDTISQSEEETNMMNEEDETEIRLPQRNNQR